MVQRHLTRPGSFGLHRHFGHLEEFIERAQAGDVYREISQDEMSVSTFKARSRRTPRSVLRVERIETDLVTRGASDYVYRTRSTTGNLFNTRNRHGDPAFLATAARAKVLGMVEVSHREHSLALLEGHHITIADAYPDRSKS